MSNIKFTATKLSGSGRLGKLTPDANGYYTLPIGGLNLFNSTGDYYTAEGARQLFEQSSVLMRRIANGNLKGENGHPKQLPGQRDDQYFNRAMTIEETNVSHHFKSIWLDDTYGKKNPGLNSPDLIAVMAEVKPCGPHGPALQASLDNQDENVCFSIRALSKDFYQNRQKIRVLQSILTWDWVTEPGLHMATKWNSPTLESMTDKLLTEAILSKIIEETPRCLAMESGLNMAMEALEIIREEKKQRVVRKPAYQLW